MAGRIVNAGRQQWSTTGLHRVDRDGSLSAIGPAGDFCSATAVLASLSDDVAPLLASALGRHWSAPRRNVLTILVAPRDAPEQAARKEEAVATFLASGPLARAILEDGPAPPAQLCYRALSWALAPGREATDLAIVHRPGESAAARTGEEASVDAILPHRGSDAHLEVALDSLDRQTHRCRTLLCFDQPPEPLTRGRLATRADVELFEVVPSPAGPYVPRQHFTLLSAADYIAFQDSDDYSLPGRVAALLTLAEREGAEIVGCHELRLNEISQTVEAIRFPLDVNRALRAAAGHVQLFPTTLVRAGTMQRTGGLSTAWTFGADRQFLLRAHWSTRIRNLDSFLYVRRRRAGSLTTAPSTSLNAPVRTRLERAWTDAFAAVGEGRTTAAESALRAEHSRQQYRIRDLRTGAERRAVQVSTE